MKAESSAISSNSPQSLPSKAANRSDPTPPASPAVFHTRLKVRWNELDANGHVNNMYYQSYFDQARIEAFEQAGLKIDELREQGIGPVIYKAELDYRRELKHPDSITVTTWVAEHRRSRAVLAQQIESDRTGDVVCTARFHGIFMELAAGRPMPFPPELLNGAAALPDYRL
ncbi:MAG: acyl-CoA thioesterase [bacterium]|nr:acyl-CoA thioesterase [bacterium]